MNCAQDFIKGIGQVCILVHLCANVGFRKKRLDLTQLFCEASDCLGGECVRVCLERTLALSPCWFCL